MSRWPTYHHKLAATDDHKVKCRAFLNPEVMNFPGKNPISGGRVEGRRAFPNRTQGQQAVQNMKLGILLADQQMSYLCHPRYD